MVLSKKWQAQLKSLLAAFLEFLFSVAALEKVLELLKILWQIVTPYIVSLAFWVSLSVHAQSVEICCGKPLEPFPWAFAGRERHLADAKSSTETEPKLNRHFVSARARCWNKCKRRVRCKSQHSISQSPQTPFASRSANYSVRLQFKLF